MVAGTAALAQYGVAMSVWQQLAPGQDSAAGWMLLNLQLLTQQHAVLRCGCFPHGILGLVGHCVWSVAVTVSAWLECTPCK